MLLIQQSRGETFGGYFEGAYNMYTTFFNLSFTIGRSIALLTACTRRSALADLQR